MKEETIAYLESLIESKLAKVTSSSIFFLDGRGKKFAGLSRNKVWMSCTPQGKNWWYSHISSLDEEKLKLNKLGYMAQCEIAETFVRKYLLK